MAIVSPLFVASVASLTLAMTTIGATINLLQHMRFSDLQAPGAAKTLLLDPTRLRAFTTGWQLQPRGVHVHLLVDGEPGVDGQRSLLAKNLGLGGRRVV